MRVIGTAGHVDHGKSTLVKRLTGIDPDRLAEEKAREMTIDLGFAWFELAEHGTVGVVDVPGHRDFIENMLAGIAGLDAVILVIAADEGIMPQTREHLAIIQLLGISLVMVALTKTDLVKDSEWLDLVEEEVTETLLEAGFQDVKIIPISAVKNEGVEQLLQELSSLLRKAPARPDLHQPRLPIDRVFSVSGFGTVVTGTLSNGSLRVGDEVEILPEKQLLRIRGLQSYGKTVDFALPGSRVAVNLSGITREQIQRGSILAYPNRLTPSSYLDAHVTLLPDASRPIKHNTELKLFIGATETLCRVRLLDKDQIEPGESGWVQFHLPSPIAVMRNDRYILRFPSPSETIAGGLIVDANPAHRWKRFRPNVIKSLEIQLNGTPSELLASLANMTEPVSHQNLREQSGLSKDGFQDALTQAINNRLLIPVSETHVFGHERFYTLLNDIERRLTEYHRLYPLRIGMPREQLRQQIGIKNQTLTTLLGFHDRVEAIDKAIKLSNHTIQFSEQQQHLIKNLFDAFNAAPYTPPSKAEAINIAGSELFYCLVELDDFIIIDDELVFERNAYREIIRGVLEEIEKHGAITAKTLRDRFETSRKYAIGILEHLDSIGITKRVGDERVRGYAPIE